MQVYIPSGTGIDVLSDAGAEAGRASLLALGAETVRAGDTIIDLSASGYAESWNCIGVTAL